MSAPRFILSPCTPEDVPEMVATYLSAFEHDYLSKYCLPTSTITPEEKLRWLNARFLKLFSSPEVRAFKITDANNGNRQAAFSRWMFPYVFSEEEKRVREEDKKERERKRKEDGIDVKWPLGADLEVCDLKFGPMDSCRESSINAEETYVCGLLAVHQDYWRQGLGGMLLNQVIAMADAEGRRMWIEATPAGRPLYAKLGFKEVSLIEVDLSRWGGKEPGRNWCMVREPQKKV
ncbi:hypothetical protein LSUB1_G000045 [Lachnellula subtilissima]|uniref:N-acetyltransferase domain-containing protein n=1 Tax=Lachnellula subtilissima TaxID=602034 RepID=A0A8H8S1J7_9HELO|nr:hypothetical protein LSUB1_G000045 [Lachnellula subtilissima]